MFLLLIGLYSYFVVTSCELKQTEVLTIAKSAYMHDNLVYEIMEDHPSYLIQGNKSY